MGLGLDYKLPRGPALGYQHWPKSGWDPRTVEYDLHLSEISSANSTVSGH